MSPRWTRILRKSLRWTGYTFLCLFGLLLMLELFYRNQWIDTYRRELHFLNQHTDLESPKPRILVMGDSFSASPDGWVARLQRYFPGHTVVNSAVPGSGVVQANYMAGNRFGRFSPEIFIYQVYVGNDLFDYRLPVNWGELGLARNLYYSAANHIRSLSWLNYAMGQRIGAPEAGIYEDGKQAGQPFSPAHYNGREKLYLKAEPGLIEHSVLLRGDRKADFDGYLAHLDALIENCGGDCEPWIIVLPHCAQVSERYMERMRQVGAEITDPQAFMSKDFPFYTALKAHFRERGSSVRVVNMLPLLRKKEARGNRLYYRNDPHLNPKGQQALGELVAAALQGLVVLE